ncbi:MAG TPA: YifB family Mg chelatase-like AAA ATPase [Planctomycetota bacterium]|nr:YifB family Mg chelatase-like AAA ATPase [Planctomycetota bacterium]
MFQRARVLSAAVRGIDADLVYVEVHLGPGLPGTSILGLPDTAVRESRDRVKAAILSSGFDYPRAKILVNLAPAHTRKEGPWFDLPIAIAVLQAARMLPEVDLASTLLVGELALDGGVRPTRGALAIALAARRKGLRRVLLAPPAAPRAALVEGVDAVPVADLGAVVKALSRAPDAPAALSRAEALAQQPEPDGDEPTLEDVVGQSSAKRALVIAAAGGHNLLFTGPPGAGKSMLARRMPGILEPPAEEEAVEITRIADALRVDDTGLVRRRPFRAPHHTTSRAGLVGGGSDLRPGEATLAHLGVLFLDELPEFARDALEALRQPIEDGRVALARAAGSLSFPARFQLVAAMNPCPCGWRGHPSRPCTCLPRDLARYRARLSGPLLDRIDLSIAVAPVAVADLSARRGDLTTAIARTTVMRARARQRARGPRENARLASHELERLCPLDAPARALLDRATERLSLSMRARVRCVRVARTIADVDGAPSIAPAHVAEALALRWPGGPGA